MLGIRSAIGIISERVFDINVRAADVFFKTLCYNFFDIGWHFAQAIKFIPLKQKADIFTFLLKSFSYEQACCHVSEVAKVN